jgi:hypothetical protein
MLVRKQTSSPSNHKGGRFRPYRSSPCVLSLNLTYFFVAKCMLVATPIFAQKAAAEMAPTLAMLAKDHELGTQ